MNDVGWFWVSVVIVDVVIIATAIVVITSC